MPESADHTPETEAKQSRGLGSYVVWGFAVVVVYVLGSGPIVRWNAPNPIVILYRPIGWGYQHFPPIRKTLDIYWHLWDPSWPPKVQT